LKEDQKLASELEAAVRTALQNYGSQPESGGAPLLDGKPDMGEEGLTSSSSSSTVAESLSAEFMEEVEEFLE